MSREGQLLHKSIPYQSVWLSTFELSYVACSLKNNVATLSQWPPESPNHLWTQDVTTLGHLTVSKCFCPLQVLS
jgi:hypothetical protein